MNYLIKFVYKARNNAQKYQLQADSVEDALIKGREKLEQAVPNPKEYELEFVRVLN